MHHHDHSQHQSYHPKAKRYLEHKRGARLEDGNLHQRAHQQWGRREFMRMTGLAALGSACMLGSSAVQAFAPSPLLASLANSDCGDRILVLIRLNGGNDGLNTIIQREDDTYYNIRPTLAVPESGLWALSQEYGMPNELSGLMPFWEEGRMKVVHNVGYPDPNYSHFRSSDIWASASDSNEVINTGWLGRWLEQDLPAFLSAPPVVPPALQIGVQANMIFRGSRSGFALAISNPAEFYQIARTGSLYPLAGLGNSPSEQELRFVRSVANSAFRYSESIQRAYNAGSNQANYPNHYLSEELAIVARMIKGGLGSKIYMVSIGGFDTHSEQANTHPGLMRALGDSVAAFFADLSASGHSEQVLAMTFSEFGRTIHENGSMGTDHGTGAPLMLFGEGLGSEFLGKSPDLLDLDHYGDPYFDIDFRSVYASVLEDWLCVPPEASEHLLGEGIGKVGGLLPLTEPVIGSNQSALLLGHEPAAGGGLAFSIHYAMRQAGQVRIQLLHENGQLAREIWNHYQEAGSYRLRFAPGDYFLPPGRYYYRLEAGGRAYTRTISW